MVENTTQFKSIIGCCENNFIPLNLSEIHLRRFILMGIVQISYKYICFLKNREIHNILSILQSHINNIHQNDQ